MGVVVVSSCSVEDPTAPKCKAEAKIIARMKAKAKAKAKTSRSEAVCW